MAAFDMDQLESLLKSVQGAGDDSKSQTKAQKEMAKLQSKLQSELASQQAQYAQQLEAQRAAESLAAQREQNAFDQPFKQGQLDLQRQQLSESTRQFDIQNQLAQQAQALEDEIKHRQIALDELTQQQNNAIAQGQLDLSTKIETEKNRLQAEQQEATIKLQQAQLSGFLDNGQLTEEARAARAKEALDKAGQLGYDPTTGQLTDASQQWRTNAALQAAQTQAQLGQQSSDYFQAAAYNRDPTVQANLAFLNAANLGSSVGFRPAATGVPGTASFQTLAGGTPVAPPSPITNVAGAVDSGPSPSVGAAEAAVNGAPAAYTTQMHEAPMDPMAAAYQTAQAGLPVQAAAAPTGPERVQPDVPGSVAIYNANATMQPDKAQQQLSQIQKGIIMPGAHKLAPGTMEGWSPTEKGLIQSALKASGVNPADFEAAYNRSKLQTNTSALQI